METLLLNFNEKQWRKYKIASIKAVVATETDTFIVFVPKVNLQASIQAHFHIKKKYIKPMPVNCEAHNELYYMGDEQ